MFPAFQVHIPTLVLVVALVMATAWGILIFVGLTQRTYRGFWWWILAQGLATLSSLLLPLRESQPELTPLTTALMLQWPVLLLIGLRRFYVRSNLPLSASADGLLFGLGFLAWVGVWQADMGLAPRVAVFSVVYAGLHLYAAWVTFHVREWRHSSSLKALLVLMLLGAVVQMPRLGSALAHWGDASVTDAQLNYVMIALGLLCTQLFALYLCLLLTYERTEAGLRESQRQLRVLADIDMLTQIPNRRHFNDLAAEALQLSPPGASSVMLFDIDHFKAVNDSFGHAAGDEALRLVARSARLILRSRDVVGRIGGDEFVALLPETSVSDALHVADRIVRHVDAERQSQQLAAISLSFGVVQMQRGESLAQAMHRADLALYEAKRQGRSRAVAAEGGHHEGAQPVFTQSRPLGLTAS
ncbi:MAG: GGDEF domain-containing protein [Burkholderiales bacterium]|nr:GGDEF domain-containing protein [Burkholderiales bacterium]